MTVYSNAVHDLSASSSGQGSSNAGPLELSLPRMERNTMGLRLSAHSCMSLPQKHTPIDSHSQMSS